MTAIDESQGSSPTLEPVLQIEDESDHEKLVAMLHAAQEEAGGRNGPTVAAIERRIQQTQEDLAWARDPADLKSNDWRALQRWLARSRAAADQDPARTAALEAQIKAVENAARAADPVDHASTDPDKIARWIAREDAALVPDVDTRAQLVAQLSTVVEVQRAAAPASLEKQLEDLRARVEALEAK